jgi:hypothetical protein
VGLRDWLLEPEGVELLDAFGELDGLVRAVCAVGIDHELDIRPRAPADDVIAQLRHAPFRPALEAIAHTLVYDATSLADPSLGVHLPAHREHRVGRVAQECWTSIRWPCCLIHVRSSRVALAPAGADDP